MSLLDFRSACYYRIGGPTSSTPMIGTPGYYRRSWSEPPAVFTIHNLAFQGLFPADLYPQLALPGDSLIPDGLEFYGKISFLKAGISYSDRLTTVSPTYAREILTAEYGCGLEAHESPHF